MQDQAYTLLAEIEDRHWWHLGRRRLIGQELRRLELPSNPEILDLGCGVGGTTRFLSSFGLVTGMDLSDAALTIAQSNSTGIEFIKGDINRVDEVLQGRHFDLATCFNVLCHSWVTNELEVLRRVKALLNPGGYVMLTEPAFKFLTRRHDEFAMSRTRYTKNEICELLQSAGFDIVEARYFNFFSLPVCTAIAALDCLSGDRHEDRPSRDDIWELQVPSGPVNVMMRWFFNAETVVGRWLKMPAGVTILAIGRA